MNELRKAAEMALESLEEYTCVVQSGTDPNKWHEVVDGGAPARKAIQALRQALAQPEQKLMPLTLSEIELLQKQASKTADKMGEEINDPEQWHWMENFSFCLVRLVEEKILDKALAQPEQEPVAVWELEEDGWNTIADPDWMETLPVGTRLYTAPPKREWVGLTDADKQEAFDETQEASGGFWEFADYLEAKLKEKNT